MIKITDLKEGMKVKIREDLVLEKEYGGITVGSYLMNCVGKVVTVKEIGNILYGTFYTFENGWFSVEMIECIIPEKVNAVDALVAMKSGKYGLNDECIYKITDTKVWFTSKYMNKSWGFVEDFCTLNAFLALDFEILDELPEWAKEPVKTNPFKVGDVVNVIVCGDGKMLREVIAINSTHVKNTTYDGEFRATSVDNCKLATLEERAEFYEKAYKHVKNQ